MNVRFVLYKLGNMFYRCFYFGWGLGGGGGNFKIFKKNFEFNFNDIVCVNDI